MNARILLLAATLVVVTAFVTSTVLSQDSAAKPQSRPADDSETLIENMVRYSMPGQHHKLLDKLAGRWKLAVKYRMDSGSPVVESAGTCERKWVLGRRFLLEEFDGGSLALPFQGMAIYGYDAFAERYTSVWIDTMSTSITTNMGTCADGCRLINFNGRHGDPWTGTMRQSRGVTRLISDTRHVLELYEPGRDGHEFRILEITYTRE